MDLPHIQYNEKAEHQKEKGNKMATVYSYIRFSSKKQELGTSLKRQKLLRDNWLNQHPEHILDKKLNMYDLGVSALHQGNLSEKAALGSFIDLVEKKQIEKGSILLLEKLDRFSRSEIDIALASFTRLLRNGIQIVTLDPLQELNETDISNTIKILMIIMQLCMANEYSNNLSSRLSHFWNIRRKEVDQNKKKLCSKTPSWIRYDKSKDSFELIEEKANAIRYIFNRTIMGYGQVQICKEMSSKYKSITKDTNLWVFDDDKEEMTSNGTKKSNWNKSYVNKILHDRSVIGEFQPYKFERDIKNNKKKRIKVGSPIKDYYPPIITNDEFEKAQFAITKRCKDKGPKGSYINILKGLVYFNDGHKGHIQTSRRNNNQNKKPYLQRRLVSYGFLRGLENTCKNSVDAEDLIDLILSMISTIPLERIVGTKEEYTSKRSTKLFELDKIDKKLSEYKQLLDISSFDTKKDIISEMETKYLQKRKIEQELQSIDQNVEYEDLKAESKTNKKDIKRYIKTLNEKDKHFLRTNIKNYLETIISRIDITTRKRSNRVVEAEGSILFYSGIKFSFVLLNLKSSLMEYIGKRIVITENGMVCDEKFKTSLNSFIKGKNLEFTKEIQLENKINWIKDLKKHTHPEIKRAINTLEGLKNQDNVFWIYSLLHKTFATMKKNPSDKTLMSLEFMCFYIEWMKRLETSPDYNKPFIEELFGITI